MTHSLCSYSGNRDEALVTFLYDDDVSLSGERAAFAAHLPACAVCREELDGLRDTRLQLGEWTPPEPKLAVTARQSSDVAPRRTLWREIPAWAQVAAALLFLGVSAAIAHLDIRYDRQGLSIRTGWSQPAQPAAGRASTDDAAAPGVNPWEGAITSLERTLRPEMRLTHGPATPPAPSASARDDAEILRRVRALVDDSEKRQQRELALRVAELLRDVNVQRQADLAKVNRALGAVENNLGVEVLK